jgi:hypothetical protein
MTVKIFLLASIFTPELSIGTIAGKMEFIEVPQTGTFISFKYPFNSEVKCPENFLNIKIKVNSIYITTNTLELPSSKTSTRLGFPSYVGLDLDDVNFSTKLEAVAFGQYIEKGFNIDFNDNEDLYEQGKDFK